LSNLKSIEERLNNNKISQVEITQREVFIQEMKKLDKAKTKALSIGCGDGIWDYLAFNNAYINNIEATNIVSCPVHIDDQTLLKQNGQWAFNQVDTSGKLPFKDNSFDLVFHQDVIEHTNTPHNFLAEQFRVLNGGDNCVWNF